MSSKFHRMKTGNKHREDLARRTQKNLEEMGCIPPQDAVRFPLKAEKPAPVDTMEVDEVEVSDADVLKYGRRVAMMMKSKVR